MTFTKHSFIGAFNIEQLKELVSVLEIQETTDREVSSTQYVSLENGNYVITIDADGNCVVKNA